MTRVTQVTNTLSRSISSGGVEVVVRTWQKAFDKLNYESSVLALYNSSDAPIEKGSRDYILIACRTLPNRPWSGINFRALIEIFRMVRKTEFLMIHYCKDFFTNLTALIAIFLNKQFVIQTHGMIELSEKKSLSTRYFIFILCRAKKILTLTKTESDSFTRMGLSNIYEITNPLEFVEISPKNRRKILLYIGRFHERKRPELAIEAMIDVIKIHPDCLLQMYGPDSLYKQKMQQLVTYHNLEQFIQIKPAISNVEVKYLLNESYIFLLPSYKEIFPMAMLEAMFYKCPVICGPDNGLYKKIENLNLVSFANNTEELSKEIIQIITDDKKWKTMSEKSYEWVVNNCDSLKVAKELHEIIRNI